MAKHFSVTARDAGSAARAGVLHTAHGDVPTPCFMPIATAGAVKHIAPAELRALGATMVLANTYHLMLRPGTDRLAAHGGLHRFMGWDGPILTDSGGFQVFSLGAKARARNGNGFVALDDDGVTFRSHRDGSTHRMTPESCLDHQRNIGSDIAMVLDVCPPQPCTRAVLDHAVRTTTRWAERSIAYAARSVRPREGNVVTNSLCTCTENLSPLGVGVGMAGEGDSGRTGDGEERSDGRPVQQLLFGIVQGGSDVALRRESAEAITALQFDGHAIGGVAVGEEKSAVREAIEMTAPMLPEDRPRYLMGIGTPDDLMHAVAQGVDMFDCVLPTRDGRHGRVYRATHGISNLSAQGGCASGAKFQISNGEAHFYERFDITSAAQRDRDEPIDPTCSCPACTQFSRAYLRHLFAIGEPLGQRLATVHNLVFYLDLMRALRERIIASTP